MDATHRAAANPLAQAAESLPEGLALTVSVVARAAGAALALYVAFDQSYDRTQVVAVAIAVVAALSVVPVRGNLGGWISVFACGALFFAGALLLDQTAGVGMGIAGAVGAVATLAGMHRSGKNAASAVGALFFSLGAVVALVFAVLLLIEG